MGSWNDTFREHFQQKLYKLELRVYQYWNIVYIYVYITFGKAAPDNFSEDNGSLFYRYENM